MICYINKSTMIFKSNLFVFRKWLNFFDHTSIINHVYCIEILTIFLIWYQKSTESRFLHPSFELSSVIQYKSLYVTHFTCKCAVSDMCCLDLQLLNVQCSNFPRHYLHRFAIASPKTWKRQPALLCILTNTGKYTSLICKILRLINNIYFTITIYHKRALSI